MSKTERVLEYLKKYKQLTTLEIQQLVYTTCPHSIIQDIRKRYGYDSVTDEWLTKSRIIEEKGKQKKETIRYKLYSWAGV